MIITDTSHQNVRCHYIRVNGVIDEKCALTIVFNLDSAYKNLILTETLSFLIPGNGQVP